MERRIQGNLGAEKDPDKRSPGWGGSRRTNGIGGREGRECREPLETSWGLELERRDPWHLDPFFFFLFFFNLLEAKV